MDTQQLVKKKSQGGGYDDVYPFTYIDAVRDRISNTKLSEILQGYNMYFLSYNGSREQTRLNVPTPLRRQGLWITYVLFDGSIVTEYFTAQSIDDETWKNQSNWKTGLANNAWVNFRGYTSERPNLTSEDDGYPFYDRTLKKYICWNGVQWINFDGTILI